LSARENAVLQDVLMAARGFVEGLSHAGLKDHVTVSLTTDDGERLASLIGDEVSIAEVPFEAVSNERLCAATLGNVTFTWVSAAAAAEEQGPRT
jgi:hypothetical protein